MKWTNSNSICVTLCKWFSIFNVFVAWLFTFDRFKFRWIHMTIETIFTRFVGKIEFDLLSLWVARIRSLSFSFYPALNLSTYKIVRASERKIQRARKRARAGEGERGSGRGRGRERTPNENQNFDTVHFHRIEFQWHTQQFISVKTFVYVMMERINLYKFYSSDRFLHLSRRHTNSKTTENFDHFENLKNLPDD